MNLKLPILILTYFMFISSVSYQFASADIFDGVITKTNGKTTVRLSSTDKKYYLTYDSIEVQNQVIKLKKNDFLSFDGSLNSELQTIHVHSLNYVGLRDILGDWNSNDDFCYRFNDFSNLTVYNKNKLRCDFHDQYINRKLNYSLNPGTASWPVLLSDATETYYMDLIIKSKTSAELTVYSNENGQVIKIIHLKR